MQADGGGAVCVCAYGLSIHTGASGAGTLRLPFVTFLIFHPLQHTCYNETRGNVLYRIIEELQLCVCVRVCANALSPLQIGQH